MSWLLDTCVLSEATRPKPHSGLTEFLKTNDSGLMFLSTLTLGELWKGVTRLPVSKKRSKLEEWLQNEIATEFRGRILPIDDAVSRRWGELQAKAELKGTPLPVIDSLLAATCLIKNLVVVTRNIDHFLSSGARVLNPWGPSGQ
jgi:predicted nucleic acid-binding protein